MTEGPIVGSAEWKHQRREETGQNEADAFATRRKFKGKRHEKASDLYLFLRNGKLSKEQTEYLFTATLEKYGSLHQSWLALLYPYKRRPKAEQLEPMTARRFLAKLREQQKS